MRCRLHGPSLRQVCRPVSRGHSQGVLPTGLGLRQAEARELGPSDSLYKVISSLYLFLYIYRVSIIYHNLYGFYIGFIEQFNGFRASILFRLAPFKVSRSPALPGEVLLGQRLRAAIPERSALLGLWRHWCRSSGAVPKPLSGGSKTSRCLRATGAVQRGLAPWRLAIELSEKSCFRAFARLGQRDLRLFDGLCKQAMPLLEAFNCQDVGHSVCLRAFLGL